jgi:hypothetical protein
MLITRNEYGLFHGWPNVSYCTNSVSVLFRLGLFDLITTNIMGLPLGIDVARNIHKIWT